MAQAILDQARGAVRWLACLIVCVSQRDAAAQITLTECADEAGLRANHVATVTAYAGHQFLVGGLAVADFNNDDWPDVFVLGGNGAPDRLFINDGDGTFTDRAKEWDVGSVHAGSGASVADFNGDGWLDLYITSWGSHPPEADSHRLYRNLGGDGTPGFVDVAGVAGVTASTTGDPGGFGSAWGDYDLDGDLDLCVVSWRNGHVGPGPPYGNVLYRNNGDGTFEDVTAEALGDVLDDAAGFQPAFADMDGDRYPELLLAADYEQSRYLVNNGDGTFTDSTTASGTGLDDNGMGQAIGDFDNDGRLDWYVTSIFHDDPPSANTPGNMLYLNQGDDLYIETSLAAGVNDGGWGWGALAVDFDQDGWLDIVEVNGMPLAEWDDEAGYLFRNLGHAEFADVAAEAGFSETTLGRAIVRLDADRDGDQDLLVLSNNGNLLYYRNDTLDAGAWLQVRLDPTGFAGLAPNGFGARIAARTGATSRVRIVNGEPSYLATSELVAHFGLGTATVVDELRVRWPDGRVTLMREIEVGQQVVVRPTCLGDVDGLGSVDVDDLLQVLLAWGPNARHPADLDDDGVVGAPDLLIIMAGWGACR